jgi:hypothetical protein
LAPEVDRTRVQNRFFNITRGMHAAMAAKADSGDAHAAAQATRLVGLAEAFEIRLG